MNIYERANSVIGKPYDAYKAHCWHLVEFLQPLAPKIDATAESLYRSVKEFKSNIDAHKDVVQEVEKYQDGDIILLGRSGNYFHAGVYLYGRVVHANDTGVVAEEYGIIKLKYPLLKGLRCKPL